MAAHVAERPVAEVPPAVPGEIARQVGRVERPPGGRTQPKIPMDVLGHGLLALRQAAAGADPAAPRMHLVNRADRARLDQLDHAAIVVFGVDLRAHLGRQLALVGQVGLADHVGFVHAMGQRLLAVHAQPALHGPIARQGVDLVGRAHHDGIQILLVDELSPIHVGLGLGVPLGGLGQVVFVDVAQCGDVLAGDRVQVVAAPAVDADDADIELLVGRAACGVRDAAGRPNSRPRRRPWFSGTLDEWWNGSWDRLL